MTLVSLLICWHRELRMAPWLIRSEDDMKNMEQDWQEYLEYYGNNMVMVRVCNSVNSDLNS